MLCENHNIYRVYEHQYLFMVNNITVWKPTPLLFKMWSERLICSNIQLRECTNLDVFQINLNSALTIIINSCSVLLAQLPHTINLCCCPNYCLFSLCIVFQIENLIFRHVVYKPHLILCCCYCLPYPMILASGGGGVPIFPHVVHQSASPSIWPAVQSLRQDLSTNPGVTKLKLDIFIICSSIGD